MVVGEEDLAAAVDLVAAGTSEAAEAASMGAVSAEAVSAAVGFVVVVSVERRTSQPGPRASEAEACHSQVGLRASEAGACASQTELVCHRSDRASLRHPAG